MSIFPLDEILTTFKDLTSRALRVKSESSITGGYSPTNLIMHNGAVAIGNGILLNVNEYAMAVLEVRGIFSATIIFEGSIDDTNWYPILATKNDGIISNTTTTIGLYKVNVATCKSIRARISSYVSGSITVVGKVSPLGASENSILLSGSTTQEIFARSIYNNSTLSINLIAPTNCKGLIVTGRIWGVTGTFLTGEGLELDVRLRGLHPTLQIAKAVNDKKTSISTIGQIWYPGASLGDAQISNIKIIGLPPRKYMQFIVNITGTFDVDEGFDFDLQAEWIL